MAWARDGTERCKHGTVAEGVWPQVSETVVIGKDAERKCLLRGHRFRVLHIAFWSGWCRPGKVEALSHLRPYRRNKSCLRCDRSAS